MTFLLLELILLDQVTDLLPLVVTSSDQEWQYEISTVRVHIGRSKNVPQAVSKVHTMALYMIVQMDLTPFPNSNFRNYYNGSLYCRQFTQAKM